MSPWLFALPSLLTGLVLAAYWHRVLRMARKARRRTGRAANLVPAERLGRLLRVVWVPAVVVWVASPFVAALVETPPPILRPLWKSVAVAWAAFAVVGAGFVATRACWKRMGSAWRMGIDPGERNPLVATGPFAYVRHPIYSLSAVMMLATAVAVPTPLLLGAAAVHWSLLTWEARREERHLLRVHGEAYREYRARVGRFVPFRRAGQGH